MNNSAQARTVLLKKLVYRILSLALLLFIFSAHQAPAQTKGSIHGTITDRDTEEPLEGALVKVEGLPWGGYTDGNGRYRILNLAPDTYTISVSLIGYAETTVKGIWVRSGRSYEQNVGLVPAPIEFEGTVVEASRVPILQPDITDTRQTVSAGEIRQLPVEDIEEIIELQAGVINGTIRGGRIGQEVYVIDGVKMKNFQEGSQEGLGLDMGILALQELSVVTNGFSAEYGQALSGVINLVTKEGGRKHEGAVRITSDGFLPDDHTYGYNRLEASVGGPLDDSARLRYFLSLDGEGSMDSDPVSVGVLRPDGSTINRLPHNEGDDLNLFGKLSYWATKDLKFTWSWLSSRNQQRFFDPHYKYNLDNTLSQRSKGNLINFTMSRIRSSSSSRASIIDARISFYRNDRYLGVLEEGYFDDRSVLFGFTFSDYRFRGEEFVEMDPVGQLGAGGAIPGYEVPTATGENGYGVQDTSIFIDAGQNPLVVRQLYEFVDIGIDWDNRFEQDFALKTGAELKLNHSKTFQRLNAYQPGGLPNFIEFYPVLGASYVQGQITAPGLVIDLGLRFDMFLPRIDYPENFSFPALGIRSSENKFALNPRLGTSIMLGEKDLMRINYGVFRQTPDFQYLFDIAFTDPFRFGNRRRGNPELQFERTTQYEFAYSRAFTEDLSFTAGMYLKQLENLVASRPTTLIEDDPQNARFFNDDFGSVRGIDLILRKRMNEYLGFTVNYTYQEARGMVSDAFQLFSNEVFDPIFREVVDLGKKEFPLDFDQTHTGNLIVEAMIPGNVGRLSAFLLPLSKLRIYSTFEYGSGLPFTKTKIDTTIVAGRVEEELVPFGTPNSERLEPTFMWNARFSRAFDVWNRQFTVFADIRNLLGRQSIIWWDPWTREPWNSEERLRTLAQEATEGAVTIPAESPDYSPQADLDGDRVLSIEEQEEAYYRALVDRWTPVLVYNEPRQLRFGLDMRF